VIEAVARDLVTLLGDTPQQRGMLAHDVAEQEERGARAGRTQQVQDSRGAALDHRFGRLPPHGGGDEFRVEPILYVE
jgi:hypothetical protein